MLGVIHRTILGTGPSHFREFFKPALTQPRYSRHWHSKTLEDTCAGIRPDYFTRSIFGLIAVYNFLPEFVVSQRSVKDFQSILPRIVRYIGASGYEEWESIFNRNGSGLLILPNISLHELIRFEKSGEYQAIAPRRTRMTRAQQQPLL